MIESIQKFKKELSKFTAAPYVVLTDCCTHAIEVCLRLLDVKRVESTAFTYLSVPMTYNLLRIDYTLTNEQWQEEYAIHGTPIWDSARCLRPGMYRPGQYQCLSFGPGKPMDNVRGGAILLDNEDHYAQLDRMVHDGRDIRWKNWIEQKQYGQGFHYMMRYEEALTAHTKLKNYIDIGIFEHPYKLYPDCRKIEIA
jgi:dTDP-4-amino-4,6-dideoxygalactose transaminase